MEYTDKDGNKIYISGVDEKTIGVVGKIVEGAMHRAQAGITETVTTAIGDAVTKHVAPLAEKVETISKAKPADPKPDDKKTPDGDSETLTLLRSLSETVTSLKTEREQERGAQTARQVAEAYVAQHRPNLKGKDVLIGRIAAAGVKDEAGAKAVAEAFDKEMRQMLGDEGFKQLSADPSGEGAKDQPKGSEAERAQAKEALLAQIKNREPVSKAG